MTKSNEEAALSAALSVPTAAVVGEPVATPGPYQARWVPSGMPTNCCEYGVISLSEGKEICRVWKEDDARHIEALLNAAPSAPDGWQPIETAPKDGTTILAYFPLEGLRKDWCRVVTVFFGGQQRGWIFAGRAASGFSREYQPTHWRPLPAPPAIGGKP